MNVKRHVLHGQVVYSYTLYESLTTSFAELRPVPGCPNSNSSSVLPAPLLVVDVDGKKL